jgi:hypothetical protein
MQEYMEGYPLGDDRDGGALVRLGLDPDGLKELRALRKQLLDRRLNPGSKQWLDDYLAKFQPSLDRVAKQRVEYYAKRVALMTASSSNALMDIVVTAYGGFAMLADLVQIYNLRVNRIGTAVLLARVFSSAYLAGRLQESENQIAKGIEDVVKKTHMADAVIEKSKLLEYLDLDEASPAMLALEAAFAKLVGKLGARAASGMVNYFMLRRLGTYAIQLLQPVRP